MFNKDSIIHSESESVADNFSDQSEEPISPYFKRGNSIKSIVLPNNS